MIGPKAIRRLIRFGALALAVLNSNRNVIADSEADILERAQRFERFVRDDAPQGDGQ